MESNEKEFNDAVRGWAAVQRRRLVSRVVSLQLKDKVALKKRIALKNSNEDYKPLVPSLGFGLKKEFGVVNRINFRFAKHGIYFEHGVGRGRPIGSANVRPNPFLAPIINSSIDELADIVASQYADIAAAEIKFSIPGIVTTRVKVTLNNG